MWACSTQDQDIWHVRLGWFEEQATDGRRQMSGNELMIQECILGSQSLREGLPGPPTP